MVIGMSALGILATFAFQVIVARQLSPAEFGLVAAFLALVNIAAIGAGALQNAIAVQVAKSPQVEAKRLRLPAPRRIQLDSTTYEAAILGGVGALIVVLSSDPLSQALNTSPDVILVAALTIPLSFFFSRDLGILQGLHRTNATVGWSTLASILRLFVTSIAVVALSTAWSAIIAIALTLIMVTIALSVDTKRIGHTTVHRPFDAKTSIVILATLLFAWLTNVDVIFIRAFTDPDSAGTYAVAATVVKASLIVPRTISLWLLPKLAGSSPTRSASGFNETLAISITGTLGLAAILLLWGQPLFTFVFGAQYSMSNNFLALVGVTFTPWVACQAILIRSNAHPRWLSILVLMLGAACQAAVFTALLPNMSAALIGSAVVGLIVSIALFAIARPR